MIFLFLFSFGQESGQTARQESELQILKVKIETKLVLCVLTNLALCGLHAARCLRHYRSWSLADTPSFEERSTFNVE